MTAIDKLNAFNTIYQTKREEIAKQYGNTMQGAMQMIKDAKAITPDVYSREDALSVLAKRAARQAM